jgi:tetratricopeptide (TPR) repeat protein
VNSVTTIQTKLNSLDEQLKPPAKKKVPEKEWLNLFHEVCSTFRSASPEERVDIQIVFEDRHTLLNLFTQYLARMAQNAAQTVSQGNERKTIQLLEEAILADAIIDGRVNMADIQRAQNQLVETADKIHFDINRFLQPLATSANTYVARAYQLQKANQRKQAMQVLGRAIQLNPALGVWPPT